MYEWPYKDEVFVLYRVSVVRTTNGRARESGRERICAKQSFQELKNSSLANKHFVTKEESTLQRGMR